MIFMIGFLAFSSEFSSFARSELGVFMATPLHARLLSAGWSIEGAHDGYWQPFDKGTGVVLGADPGDATANYWHDAWSMRSPIPAPSFGWGVFTNLDNDGSQNDMFRSVYLCGGIVPRDEPPDYVYWSYSRLCRKWDSVFDVWSRMSDMSGIYAGEPYNRITGVGYSAVGSLGNTGYYCSGRVHGTDPDHNLLFFTKNVDAYHVPGDSWRGAAPLPTVHSEGDAATVADRLYVFGGEQWDYTEPNPQYIGGGESYNGSWRTEPNMPWAGPVRLQAFNDKIYAMGVDYFNYDEWIYEHRLEMIALDPAGGTWTSQPDTPTPLFSAATFALTGQSYPQGMYAVKFNRTYRFSGTEWAVMELCPSTGLRCNTGAEVS